MRKVTLLFILAIMLYNTPATAQEYFSKVYNFGFPNVVFGNMIKVGDSLVITALITDTQAPQLNSIVVVSDLYGNGSRANRFQHNYQSFDVGRPNFVRQTDSTFYAGAETYVQWPQAGIIRFNREGKIFDSRFFTNPDLPEDDFVITNEIIQLASNELLLAIKYTSKIDQSADVKVYRLTEDFEILDSVIVDNSYSLNILDIEVDKNSDLVFGIESLNLNFVQKDFVFQNIIQKRDTNFNLIWEYITPEDSLLSVLFDVEITSDNGIVAATYRAKEETVSPHHQRYCMQDIYLYKLSEDGELMWETVVPEPFCHENGKFMRVIQELADQSILVAGSGYYEQRFRGTILKFDSLGNLLWQRFHRHEEKEASKVHQLNDMIILENGDIMFCGESSGPQEGWLMRVDSNGCLIPGCITAIDEVSDNHPVEIMLYPNPVSDQLIIHIASQAAMKDGSFTIVNMQGQVVRQWINDQQELTHILDVADLTSGQYQLIYTSNGAVLETKPFVKK